MRRAVQEAERLRRAMEDNDRAIRQLMSSAAQVQSAYTYALGRVRRELNSLESAFQVTASAGLNVIAILLDAVVPAVDAFANLMGRLFGVTYWKSTGDGAERAAASLGRAAQATKSVAEAQRDLLTPHGSSLLSPRLWF